MKLLRNALLGFVLITGVLLAVLRFTPLGTILLGAAQAQEFTLPPGNLPVPTERTLAWNSTSAFADEIQQAWAARPLGDARAPGKSNAPRVVLARLITRTKLEETNAFIRDLRPWGTSGSRWALHPNGDYDFTLAVLTAILWLRGDDSATLFPATREHLLHVLLTEDGGDFRATAPRTLGIVKETENHILMTEGSRYLKNRWLQLHGDSAPRHDNVANGLEGKLLAVLAEHAATGLYEFNSQPYIGYTITALLNLEAFAAEPVRLAAREVLDLMNWSYALGSYRLRHFPPFRRRYEYAAATSLTFGYQSAFLKTWLSFAPGPMATPALGRGGDVHALFAACLPYRPPDRVVRLIFEKGVGYFAQLGHGPGASPEIYSAGPHYLFSAGGTHRGERSQLIARPTTLLLDDDAVDLADVFHLAGPGPDFRRWNNTGVYRDFACAAGPVHMPARFKAAQQNGAWRIFAVQPGLTLAVYSTPTVGLLAVFRDRTSAELLRAIQESNPDPAALAHSFQFPHGPRLTYDLASPPDRWVMVAHDGQALDREFDRWPLIAGHFD
jgi:hypothetical protein